MEITYPFARVFTDKTNNLNVFFDESPTSNLFEQLKDIGKCVVEFCELDFSECLEELKKLDTKIVSTTACQVTLFLTVDDASITVFRFC